MANKDSLTESKTLSLWGKVSLFGLIPVIIFRWIIGFAFPTNKALHWRQSLALTFQQAQRATLSTDQLRWVTRRTLTGTVVRQYCDRHQIPHDEATIQPSTISVATRGIDKSVSVPSSTLHFVTPASAAAAGPTLLYFHGGGFVNPLRAAAHMPLILSCASACKAKQVAILEYALAPQHQYPTQFVQAVLAFRYLLDNLSLCAEDIILAGDSAGAQLAGAVLAHLADPSPYVSTVSLVGRIRAVLFMSPFTLLQENQESYDFNNGKDYLNRPQVRAFKDDWSPIEDEVWANLCGAEDASEVWGRVFPSLQSKGLVKKAMIVVGSAEVLLDNSREFARDHLRAETVMANRETDWKVLDGKDFVLVECEGESHVQAALDAVVGHDKGAMTLAIKAWLANV
ncbi:Alpha/Beta hydrolase protein [Podospora didyma]|uniref:Alpha/Beta hydrolase protein n=1 Tax=Podospora didyma TaxID=330526 RepID=A0AAE0N2W8_9PEZI|nr:Alpha/Beta hydrolase protein [Podospora didyma]